MDSLGAVNSAWLNASQTSRVGVRMNNFISGIYTILSLAYRLNRKYRIRHITSFVYTTFPAIHIMFQAVRRSYLLRYIYLLSRGSPPISPAIYLPFSKCSLPISPAIYVPFIERFTYHITCDTSTFYREVHIPYHLRYIYLLSKGSHTISPAIHLPFIERFTYHISCETSTFYRKVHIPYLLRYI